MSEGRSRGEGGEAVGGASAQPRVRLDMDGGDRLVFALADLAGMKVGNNGGRHGAERWGEKGGANPSRSKKEERFESRALEMRFTR